MAEAPTADESPRRWTIERQIMAGYGLALVIIVLILGTFFATGGRSLDDSTTILLISLFALAFPIIGVLIVRRDQAMRRVTDEALRASEARLQAILDNTTAVIYVKDLDGRYVLVNRRFEDLFNVRRQVIEGQTDYDVFPHPMAEVFRANDRRVLATASALDFEEVAPRDDGPHTYLSTKFPLFDEVGQPYAVCGISTDITERQRLADAVRAARDELEERVEQRTTELASANASLHAEISQRRRAEHELRAFMARLEQSNRDLEQFASVASHDLQEPLRKVQAFGDRLRARFGEALPRDGRDYLDRMLQAADRMRILISDLLAFSRVRTKGAPFVAVDLGTLAREASSDLEARLEETGGRVEIEPLPVIDADPMQMRQLMQNLLGNSLKFHRPGVAPVVSVRGRVVNGDAAPADHGMCRLEVEDNGIGFDEKYLDRIFAPFQRLHGRGEYEGTGIGLAICRKIAERHGGQITATSRLGAGTTFIVTLPASQQDGESPHEG